jgi:hypothetical protein
MSRQFGRAVLDALADKGLQSLSDGRMKARSATG